MKKLILTTAIILLSLSTYSEANTDYAKRVGGYFYTSLSPYGTWIEIGFGTPVWRPTVMRKSWSPYSNGRWIYTDYGWYWDSYENFGAIVYHYGRWFYDDYYGWIWVPDYEWAPAWVEWRYDDYYVGWAPLSPYATFSVSVGINYTYDYHVPYSYWNFVKYNHFCDNNVYKYYIAPKYKYKIYHRSNVRTNYSYYDGRVRNNGVDYDRIREKSGRSIEKRNLVTVNNPNEITRKSTSSRDNEIRTYIGNREDISSDGLRDVTVKRSSRKSSLELSKVEIGSGRDVNKTTTRTETQTRSSNSDNRTNTITRDKKQTETQKQTTRDNKSNRSNNSSDVQKRNQNNNSNENSSIQRNNKNSNSNEKQNVNRSTQKSQSNNTSTSRSTEVNRTKTNSSTNTKRNTTKSEENSRTKTR